MIRLARSVVAVLLALAAVAVPAFAQQSSTSDQGSLAAIGQEVRQLRLAVEESMRTQTQVQALSVFLSAEQSRLVQLSSRLDAAHADVRATADQSREITAAIANAQSELAKNTITPQLRAEIEGMLPTLKQRADRAAEAEAAARARENELAQSFQAEEAHWADLIGRLEQIIKK